MTKQFIQKISSNTVGTGGTNILANFQQNSGSTETQIYILTQKVARLSSHLKIHKKDYSSQRGLRKILGQRKRLLTYLSNEDVERYESLLVQLGIRGLKKM
uniref:ribosomal protein S15 n=1 Tax=Cosmarium blyttii TaxID=328281 RepID=UPI0020294B6F|nr:ribosomal protein S15 [Cosmarium blyttii]UPO65183.1 ribosomal protein S15 [Cosmarium blyttii]